MRKVLGELMPGRQPPQAVARWKKALARVDALEPNELTTLLADARDLRREVDFVATHAGRALRQRVPLDPGFDLRPALFQRPLAQRVHAAPDRETRLDEGVGLFHDGDPTGLLLRQSALSPVAEPCAFGLQLDVYQFEGSYLSLVFDLPAAVSQGAAADDVVWIAVDLASENPGSVYLRLNLQHGPNHTEVLRHLPELSGPEKIAFDLSQAKLSDKPVEHMWLDLIFESPAMNRFRLHDLQAARRPRAQL